MTVTLTVHRCRFPDWSPSAITSIAFPPARPPKTTNINRPPSNPQVGFLAIGRANGDIELCEWAAGASGEHCRQAWVPRKILRGAHRTKVDSLAFAHRDMTLLMDSQRVGAGDLRMFSTGGGSILFEWDLDRGLIHRAIPSQGGSIWSLAVNPSSTLLAIGCEDGAIRILSLVDNDVVHLRRFDRIKAKALSIAWGPPEPPKPPTSSTNASDSDDDDPVWNDSWLVTGCSDSCLRKWDYATGRVIERMTVDHVRREKTLVWAVGTTMDGTVVSGDSLGFIRFWDAHTSTQLQSFKAHRADVLCLVVGPSGHSVYTSGIDQKVAEFSHITVDNRSSNALSVASTDRWIQSCARQLHSHDVRALAIWPPHSLFPIVPKRGPSKEKIHSGLAPVLVSGGLDMSALMSPCAPRGSASAKLVNLIKTGESVTFEEGYHRRLSYSLNTIQVARNARLMLCRKERSVSIWKINESPRRHLPRVEDDANEEDHEEPEEDELEEPWSLLLEMDLQVQTNLQASALSSNGQWLAISDAYEIKLFHLRLKSDEQLHPKRIKYFVSSVLGQLSGSLELLSASSLTFTPDSTKLIIAVTRTAEVVVVDLGAANVDSPVFRVLRTFKHHTMRDIIVGDGGGRKSRVVKGLPRSISTGSQESEALEREDESMDDADEESVLVMSKAGPSVVTMIVFIANSADGQWLATADFRGRVHVFNIDSMQHHRALPSFEIPIVALAFDTHIPNHLFIAFSNNSVQLFDVEAGKFPDWSQDLLQRLPNRIGQLQDPPLGLSFNPSTTPERAAYLWGTTWICKIYLEHGTDQRSSQKRRRESTGRKNGKHKQHDEADESAFALTAKYRQLTFVDFIGPDELVVVERPFSDILPTLPPAFFKPKYGT